MTEAAPIVGRLELRGLVCIGRHGSSPEQRQIESTFIVDLGVLTDLGPAARADDLQQAVDLAGLAAAVRDVIGGPSRVLLETVVVEVAQHLLQRFAALQQVQVRVSVANPAGLGAAEEAIDLTLARA
jgi:7,8-dihydroneopterin aldolase/epimerase/oxygenase